jgi:hypothetical protein
MDGAGARGCADAKPIILQTRVLAANPSRPGRRDAGPRCVDAPAAVGVYFDDNLLKFAVEGPDPDKWSRAMI